MFVWLPVVLPVCLSEQCVLNVGPMSYICESCVNVDVFLCLCIFCFAVSVNKPHGSISSA